MSTRPARPIAEVLEETYSGRRVLVTGHSGFVGSWLSLLLARAGAEVTGISLPPSGPQPPSAGAHPEVENLYGDITEAATAAGALAWRRPEVVFHLAAQALVIPSFADPLATFSTNVMGTARLLDAVAKSTSVRACVVVTSDKCYAPGPAAHTEEDALGGDDPYSASKGCAELVTHAYLESFLAARCVGVATARAGNIVGGGDWAADRLVPDCIRALRSGEEIELRNPSAVRPWQHVLDALAGYLRLGAALLADGPGHSEAWNFGPPPGTAATVGEVVAILLERWRSLGGAPVAVRTVPGPIEERAVLTLASAKSERRLGWSPRLDLSSAIEWSVDWYHRVAEARTDEASASAAQVDAYLELDAAHVLGATHPELVRR